MWNYNGEDDASRCGRKGPDTPAALAKILAKLFKGEEEEFLCITHREGYSMYNPPSWVSPQLFCSTHSSALALLTRPFITSLAKDFRGALQPRPAARGPQSGP